ncbi:MAG: 3'(2'),5'-bisphosphate nucleotidase CysQ [Candidatus Moranbacteria bacterium]|jgi:3'(2'), 5'-bisphosphate nucleotidase|nr:3'(2'),5'-bisphosphate nucleotidase CysQ [Candidatus Moranbacteria bacterium]
MHNINIKEIIGIAKKAGDIAMSFYEKKYGIKDKKNKTPVTEADLAINKFLFEKLLKFGYPILSEESQDDFKKRKNAEYLWIIDPLDGTSDFIEKTDEFSILIGLVKNNKPVLGVVYEPAKMTTYWAEKGKGAFMEKCGKIDRLQVSKKTDPKEMTMLFSRNHLLESDVEIYKKLGIGKRRKRGSTSKICVIARGNAEIYVNTSDKTSEWDTCVPEIILTEAGGAITDIRGNKLVYNKKNPKHLNGFMASNGEGTMSSGAIGINLRF